MAQYHHKPMAELAHQLQLSPVRLRLRQFEAAEYLVDLLEAEKNYPYDFVCHHLTGYKPKGHQPCKPMLGSTLTEDIIQLIEDLSSATLLPVGAMRTNCWTTEELAQRLNVSTKTVCRWRRRGLPSRKFRYPDGTVRTAFLERSVRRFVSRNLEMVQRGAAFKQLTESEKEQIIARAQALLATKRVKLHELLQTISAETGRAIETIRYTLRKWNQANPDQALLVRDDQTAIQPELREIYEAFQAGESEETLAERFGRDVDGVRAAIREYRARVIKGVQINFIYNAEFDVPGADAMISSTLAESHDTSQAVS
ncbi:MAG: hypothetical protein FWC56_04215, partial [Phycisphaerae bacterium]|nr:hypothetical protein [Phycisphaerae bacterium]